MIKKICAISAISLLATQASADSNFSQLVIFGDSLMDTGNLGVLFTNQKTDGSGEFAPIAPQLFADAIGLDSTALVAGGNNYAVGGYQTADIAASIFGAGVALPSGGAIAAPSYLTATGGVIPSGTLILMDGGGNDIVDLALNNAPADIPGLVVARAQTFVASIGALDAAGADYIMVANAPDIGNVALGQAAALSNPAAGPGLSATSAGFNQAVSTFTALSLPDANIIPVDINGFLNYIINNTEAYGLASGELDISSAFGAPSGTVLFDQAFMCYNASSCIEHPIYGINGSAPDPRKLIFNDALHPTEIVSELFADYLVDIVAAPTKVGLLPELAMAAGRNQVAVSSNELRSSRWSKPEGRLFISGDTVTTEFDANGNPEASSTGLTVGRTFVSSDNIIYGAALSVSSQEIDDQGVDYEADSWGLTGLIGYRKDNWFVDATAGITSLSYDDLDRDFSIGSETLTAEGDTEGTIWVASVLAGYDLMSSDTLHVAPVLGLQYMKASVDAYRESGGGISNYRWGDQDRKSLELRYGVVASADLADNFTLFGELIGATEDEGDSQDISITNTNLQFGSYNLPSYSGVADDSYVTATVGASFQIKQGGSLSLVVNASDREEGNESVMFSYSMPM
ncbi:MAG: outer membrane lipase/esterase [Oceanicoccus sp.]|jgi:outer membrane lipase/esterase